MKVAEVEIFTEKDTILQEMIFQNEKPFLNGIDNPDDASEMFGDYPTRLDFLPVCIDVSEQEDLKVQIKDIIKKNYNSATNYEVTIYLEIEQEDV